MKTTAVLRKDGSPFASKNNATTRIRNLGIEDSHTVESYGDGYAIFPKAMNEERVTLQPGDYIATTDLSEDDYHNVARAFMAAGAGGGEYPDIGYMDCLDSFGWSETYEKLWHYDIIDGGGFTRQLTLSQIVNATNAGNSTHAETTTEPTTETTPMHLTDRLEAARITLESAQAEYDALLEEHKAAYPKLHGLSVQVDITPEDWRAGDVVECVSEEGRFYTNGEEYIVERVGNDCIFLSDNGSGDHAWPLRDGAEDAVQNQFRFIRRP